MVREKKPKANIEEQVLQVVREVETKNQKTQLRFVRWVIDGKATRAKYEKRTYFIKDGKSITGKCVGLDREDLQFVVDHWDEVQVFFG